MADVIKYKAAGDKFDCGHDFTNLTVVTFVGPGDSKICAYCCNINLDLDGDPQAYAPLSKPKLRPLDYLGNGGWKTASQNAALQVDYEKGKKEIADLEQKKADLLAKVKAVVPDPAKPAPAPATATPVPAKGAAAPAKAAPDPAIVALDKEIAAKKKKLREISFEHTDPNDNWDEVRIPNPKNFGKIFWKWYGVVALTPHDAKSVPQYLELGAPTLTLRRPEIDKTSFYEDVFGRFPVVQSVFEPGPEYFVTSLPKAAKNTRFPSWDQRYFLPHDAYAQQPFGAISSGLMRWTSLCLFDNIFAMRLDTDDTSSFTFLDTGHGFKVAECSLSAYTSLGGDFHPEREGAAKFPNDFLVLYLAFPGGQTSIATLAKFATATNAADFPVMLAFLAQATVDAQTRHSKVVTGDPMRAFEVWKKSKSPAKPTLLDHIVQGLGIAGSDFAERMMRTHGDLFKGPFLEPPTKP